MTKQTMSDQEKIFRLCRASRRFVLHSSSHSRSSVVTRHRGPHSQDTRWTGLGAPTCGCLMHLKAPSGVRVQDDTTGQKPYGRYHLPNTIPAARSEKAAQVSFRRTRQLRQDRLTARHFIALLTQGLAGPDVNAGPT